MIINPIIPLWLMIIISILLVIYIIKYSPQKIKTTSLLIVAFLFLINIRIMYRSDNSLTSANDLDVLFVIDSTISMNAEDYPNSTRLIEAKKDCQYIVDELDGARFSIIHFNNNSKVMIPFTRDNDLVKNTIEIVNPLYEYYAHGSSLNTPMKDMKETLKRSKDSSEERIRVVFFISDGEITDDSKLSSYKELQNYVDTGAVLGYGTTSGGNMKTTDYWGESSYVKERKDYSKKGVSKLDENNLKTIASDLNIDYIYMKKQSNIDSKLKEIKKMTKTEITESNKASYEDTYFIFLIPLFILLVINYKRYKEVYTI